MSRHPSVRRPLSRLLLLGLGLCLSTPAESSDDDELRGQRATRRVLREQEQREDISDAARALARTRRHQAIEMLGPIIKDATGERRAQMILRLAEFYAAEADDLRADAYETWDTCLASGKAGCPDEPADLHVSLDWRARAERLYDQVIRGYPQLDAVDQAAWGRAMALLELDRPDEAMRSLTWLVKNHPASEHVPSAYVLIGDHHFDNDRALPALNAYRKSAAFTQAEIRPYALYKQAWCLFNLGEYDQAIDVMRVLALDPGEGSMALQDEARRDLARFFADAGDWHGALVFFGNLGRPDLLKRAMLQVARHAREQGKTDLSVKALTLLTTELPHEPDAPGWQAEIVEILHGQGRPERALDALELLLRDYGPSSAWARANATERDALQQAEVQLEKTLRSVAVDWHQQARKLKRGPEAEGAAGRALAAYQAWLERFEGRPEAHELRYAYAELLYDVGRNEQAWTQYREVVQRDPRGARSLFCAESAVYVAVEVVGEARRGADGPPGVEPVALGPWEQRLIEGVDGYLALQPVGERSLAFASKAAWLLYHRNHFAPAADRFMAVIAMDPGSEEAEIAANLILDSLNLVGDYAKLVETAEAFLALEGLGRPGFHEQLRGVHQRAGFRLVERVLELDGDRGAAALAFEAFAARHPDSEVAHLALHNAAVHYRVVGERHGAIRAAVGLVERYAESEHRAEAMAGLGFDHESIADFDSAASWYERFVHEVPEHPEAPDALWSAALFRLALEQPALAQADLELHSQHWPEHPRQAELLGELAQIHEAAERWGEAGRLWGMVDELDAELVTDAQRAHAVLRQGRAAESQGLPVDAQRSYVALLERWAAGGWDEGADPLLRESVAEALYRVGELGLAQYESITLDGRNAPGGQRAAQAWASRQVAAKIEALLAVEQAHAAVLDAGAGGWGLAALVRLGGAYEHMAVALRDAWVPPWLSDEQAELYRFGLDDEAWRFEEKAVDAYRHAVGRSRELAVYGDYLDRAGRRLTELRPEDFPGVAEDLLLPDFQGVGLEARPIEREP